MSRTQMRTWYMHGHRRHSQDPIARTSKGNPKLIVAARKARNSAATLKKRNSPARETHETQPPINLHQDMHVKP